MNRNLSIFKRISTPRNFRLPRIWSNVVLREIAPLFEGDIINVSGWKDSDKEGGCYSDYFYNASSYVISNYGGARGESDNEEYQINLESDLPSELCEKFDVVFKHTTLEHIFDVFKAMENLCRMSKDVVILVVPFVQQVHHQPSYLDYWRFTHHSLKFLFKRNGYEVVFFSSTPYANSAIYHFCVGTKNPKKWINVFENFGGEVNTGKGLIKDVFLLKALRKLGLKIY